jgi:hypothetical protein
MIKHYKKKSTVLTIKIWRKYYFLTYKKFGRMGMWTTWLIINLLVWLVISGRDKKNSKHCHHQDRALL